ncbi:MAG: hypothetical protein ACLURG_02955 [Gemmiger sp.]
MSSGRIMNLLVTIPAESRRMNVGKDVIRILGSPTYICVLQRKDRNQKPLAPEITLAATHHDRQKQVEVKRLSRVNPHEIRLFSGCPYAVVK